MRIRASGVKHVTGSGLVGLIPEQGGMLSSTMTVEFSSMLSVVWAFMNAMRFRTSLYESAAAIPLFSRLPPSANWVVRIVCPTGGFETGQYEYSGIKFWSAERSTVGGETPGEERD